MSDHLPECDLSDPACTGNAGGHIPRFLNGVACVACKKPCDCSKLRACEQRVRGDWEPWCNEVSYDAGVQAARDAVAAAKAVDISAGHLLDESRYFVWMHDALAAIDALREPPHVDPCDCDRCRAAVLRGGA